MPANSRVTRIGVLTGGGDCPGLNAVNKRSNKTCTGLWNVCSWNSEWF